MKTSITWTKKVLTGLAVAAFWLIVWHLISLAVGLEMLFPQPLSVLRKLLEMMTTASFWKTIIMTVGRVLIGFTIGALLGAVFALLAFKSQLFEKFISPIVYIVKSTPVASFIIIVLFWAGPSNVPAIICALMVIPITCGSLLMGLKSVNRVYIEMADVYKLDFAKRLRYIFFPSVLPYIASSFSTGLGLCWKAGIAAEVICRADFSIGNQIYESKLYTTIIEMFAWTVVVVILSVLFDKALNLMTSFVKNRFADGEASV